MSIKEAINYSNKISCSNLKSPESFLINQKTFPQSLKHEVQLLLYSIATNTSSRVEKRVEKILSSEIDWDFFVKFATYHGLFPLSFKYLNERSNLIASSVFEKLKDLNRINTFNCLYLTNELVKILALLEENGIKALPHKGPVLAGVAYGDVSLRQFVDLDILISKKDIIKTKEIFHTIDYFPRGSKTTEQDQVYIDSSRPYNYKFVSKNGKVFIELHWKFTSNHNSFPIDYESLMSNLTTVKISNQTVSSLKIEDMIVILCQHGSKHFWTRLLWVCDIAMLVHEYPEIDWDRVIDFSVRSGAKRMLFWGLNLAQLLFNVELPDDIRRQIDADRKIKKLTNRIIDQLSNSKENSIQGFETHKISCEMRERWRDKIRYSAYHLLPEIDRVFPLQKRIRNKMK